MVERNAQEVPPEHKAPQDCGYPGIPPLEERREETKDDGDILCRGRVDGRLYFAILRDRDSDLCLWSVKLQCSLTVTDGSFTVRYMCMH